MDLSGRGARCTVCGNMFISLVSVSRWPQLAAALMVSAGCRTTVVSRVALADTAMLDAARGVAAWLRSTHQTSSGHAVWPTDAMRPSTHGLDLSDGVAGQVLFFSELYAFTRDT